MSNGSAEKKLKAMREGGHKLGRILAVLLEVAQPGVRLNAIETMATELIGKTGGTPSFQTVKGYSWATCLCVNEAVVHGVPSDVLLTEGDILTIDVGLLYKGFHTDTAWTTLISNIKHQISNIQIKNQKVEEKEKFLRVGEEALKKAIEQARVGNRVGHISQVIQETIEGAGYHIVHSLVGHGVGKKLHEEPQIPGFLKKRDLAKTPELHAGMTLAIEVIYARGSGGVTYESADGWTIKTSDKSDSAVFEHTITVTSDNPVILTARTN